MVQRVFPCRLQNSKFYIFQLLRNLRYFFIEDVLNELVRKFGADFPFELSVLHDQEKEQPEEQKLHENGLQMSPFRHFALQRGVFTIHRGIYELHDNKIIMQHLQQNHFKTIPLIAYLKKQLKYTFKFFYVAVKYYKMMKNHSSMVKETSVFIQEDCNKENYNQNLIVQYDKQKAQSQKVSSLIRNKDIQIPPKVVRRDQRPSLLQQVLVKKLKVNLGTSNIDRNILQVNSHRNNSRVDLTLISQLSKYPHHLSKPQGRPVNQLKLI